MESKQWLAEYTVGVQQIDEQHQQLFALQNELIETIERNLADNEVVGEALDRLVTYTEKHFQFEEAVLEKYNYPDKDFDQHKQQHRDFLLQVMKWMNEYLDGDETLLPRIVGHISNWLTDHVLKEDKRYYDYFLYTRLRTDDMTA